MKTLCFRFVVLAAILMAAIAYAGNSEESKPKEPKNYEVRELPPIDGTSGSGNSINNRKWITGVSSQFNDEVVRATLWIDGIATDLGALGGDDANSGVIWPLKTKEA